ncbi:stabilin-2 [Chanos chanos]|uniref:Stabilin-2 n=1 Tax=Chanos chanos TaxID=29144 RepID=A0A6J2VPZ7_CHACN|nr:stabilin-2 [Chanos chanos]
MELMLNPLCGTLAFVMLLLTLPGTEMQSVASTTRKGRCDKTIQVMTKTECHSCAISYLVPCPPGYSKKSSNRDCSYHINTMASVALTISGCSHECYKDVMEPNCCPGYWGTDCIECPESAENPCSNNGVCSDGMGGNGTCSCKPGFEGTACERCEENRYGPTCSSVCSCKHGLCNSGKGGDGRCTCFSGYTGANCDQELPGCAALGCGPNARCIEEFPSGQLVCKCKSGYQGDGVQCTSINPCLRSVCHAHAACVHIGPNQHACTCDDGYSGDGVVCMPIDPCQTQLGGCPADSTRCLYDGPGKSHCECLSGFENLVAGVGCSLKDVCKPDSCHKNANCTTVEPGVVECRCHDGYLGNGKICFGNILQRLQELNSEPGGKWTSQLSNAITLFESVMPWPLTSLGPFTVFVPINRGFKGSVKTLLANEQIHYLCKLHMVAGEKTAETLKRSGMYYTLTGKSAETVEEDGQVKIRIHGSRKKGGILQSDIIASNGMIHIINKMMDSVPPTVMSQREENLMKILSDNGKFSKLKALFQKTSMKNVLDEAGPYTLFAPTNSAFDSLKEGYLDYLVSDAGETKLLELLRNHVVASAKLEVVSIVSNPPVLTMANQGLTFNLTDNGRILVNGEAVLEADVEAKNGRLYSLEGVLIPSSIEPVLPHRCDITESRTYMGPCVGCAQVTQSTCPTGESLNTFKQGCVFMERTPLGFSTVTRGCSLLCNGTWTTPICCKGFFGPNCSPCPGGFSTPCLSHGRCIDGIEGNGTCVCEPNFKGSRCQYCSNPEKYGPACDKTCGCLQGVCDNRPESDGSCKRGSCNPGFTGKFCERHVEPCGPNVQYCHAHADCDYNGGAVTCVCKPGFQGDGLMCVETDPCALPHRGGCSVNAKCVKLGPGKHRCQCLSGWREDGDECQPINNCLDPSRGGCHPNATCIYVGPGQSDCACKSGYRGNGQECEAINPCVERNGGCHYLASCQYQSAGAWKCVCEEGYSGDGKVCYGTVAQELAADPDIGDFSRWVNKADLSQMLAETENITVFVPSAQAIERMTREDKDFWLSSSNLPSLVRCHIVAGVFSLTDLRASSTLQLTSFLKKTLPVFWKNETTTVGGATIISADIVAKNGLIHVIDTVLVADHKLSEGLLEVLDQRAEFSIFRSYLIQYNLTDEMEQSGAFTVFAPTDSAIRAHLKQTGLDALDANVTQYHIVLSERLRQRDIEDGMYKDTMLGYSFQLGIFLRDNKMYVNDVQVNVTDVESSKGVIHGLSAVMTIPHNRCDKQFTRTVMGSKRRCMYSRVFQGQSILTMGCKQTCVEVSVSRQCCAGFYGTNCEKCPGPEGQPCFGNGVCVDGTNGTGICQCSQGFNGTACETCETGKYGIHCDQDCKCVHGQCKDGLDGDGTCECDVGWRGITCSIAITSDSCGGKCHTSANCLLKVEDSSYYCSCAAGFQGNGTHCTAIDPCEKNNGGCSSNAVCKRTLPGRRKCVCNPGHAGDGLVCVSINPCLEGNGGCHVDADCVHTGPNKTACVCKEGYSGNGKISCTAVNLCQRKNGGCHRYARCQMTGPGERNCTCIDNYVGDGTTCKGTINKELLGRKLRDFYLGLMMSDVLDLKARGPFTVFAPNAEAFRNADLMQLSRTDVYARLMRNHIVMCQSLLPEDLTKPRNLTTLMGNTLTVSYSEGSIYINKGKVVYSDEESINGIFHEIDAVLIPPGLQTVDSNRGPLNLTDLAELHGFKTFLKLLEDTEVMELVNDPRHQPVTLFLPTDTAMAALPQEQKDFLYGMHNRAQLVEYLKYHILWDTKAHPVQLIHSPSLKTVQGSDISVSCAGEDHIGELFVNDKNCRLRKMYLKFSGGVVYGIDCLLTPPSLGGRCDVRESVDITMPCRQCRIFTDCPPGTKEKEVRKCDIPLLLVTKMSGCQTVCSVSLWKPKCCAGYYGRDCLACPGGPGSPCSNHGKCDADHLGNGTCTCDEGFRGTACELCLDGRFGPDCKVCNCTEHGSCDQGPKGTGSCFCEQGWTGLRCESQLGESLVCSPACDQNAVCRENNTCVCKPFYAGDGITCKPVNICQFWNGGCARVATCSQEGEKVTCTCPKEYKGDGYVCTPLDPCAAPDNGGCHEHATCTMTSAGKKKCECKSGYMGDGTVCEAKQVPVNRCLQENGQCHKDAKCTDLHYEDKTVGVFHYRSPNGTYELNYTEAQKACQKEGATLASYIQLSYAQQAGFHFCAAGWLQDRRVAYPTTYSNPKCGFGHVGIVDYGTRKEGETWDTFCFRIKDVKCECKSGYIGDGYSCTGNLLQVISARPTLSNFLSQVLNYSKSSASGKAFVKRLSDVTIQSTLFAPDNSGLYDNESLTFRDIEHHLLDGRALALQDLINVSHVRSRLGHSLSIAGVPNFQNPKVMTSAGYINNQFVLDSNILASNGILHVLQGPLKAPPPNPTSKLHAGHRAGLGIGILLLVLLIGAAGFVGYHFYTHKKKPFQFHYFREYEEEETVPAESCPNICNPVYDSNPVLSDPALAEEDKHKVVSSGSYDLQES